MEAIIVPLLSAAGASTGVTTAASAIGTSGLFSALGALGTVASGIASFSAGQQQQSMYNLQAQQAQIQARQAQLKAKSDEVKYRQQGVAALDRTLSTAAAIAARAGAGSIDPFSGSAGALATFAFGKGFGEFNLAQESAALTRETGAMGLAAGDLQAGLYQMSGQQAGMAGAVKGISSAFSGLYEFSKIGGPGTATQTSLLNYPSANVPLPPTGRPIG